MPLSELPITMAEIQINIWGEPFDGDEVFRVLVGVPFTFPANFAGSSAAVGTAETDPVTISIYRNRAAVVTLVGTIVFDGGATFATVGGVALDTEAGDVYTGVCDDTDDTFADIVILLVKKYVLA